MNLDAVHKIYERDGVAIIPGVFSLAETEDIRSAAYAHLATPNLFYKHERLELTASGHPALLYWPSFVSTILDDVRRDLRLVKIVRHFLGDDVKQLNNQVYFRESGDGDEFAWHQDVQFRKPRERYPGIESAYLQTLIVVDPITEENGAVEFIPESHRLGEFPDLASLPLRKFERKRFKGKLYTAQPGDVMIWSVMAVHGSERNESAVPRMTYMNGFAKASASLDWPHYLKNGSVAPIDPTQIP